MIPSKNTTVQSFPLVANAHASILVLGSMPGVVSLQINEYYAHPRNAFWPMMQQFFNIDVHWPYAKRLATLQSHGIALWDVLQQCERKGSLDQSIKVQSRIPNQFEAFFQLHSNIRLILFNGAEAEKSFMQLVAPHVDLMGKRLVKLPSSSPAHAIGLQAKLAAWQILADASLASSL